MRGDEGQGARRFKRNEEDAEGEDVVGGNVLMRTWMS